MIDCMQARFGLPYYDEDENTDYDSNKYKYEWYKGNETVIFNIAGNKRRYIHVISNRRNKMNAGFLIKN